MQNLNDNCCFIDRKCGIETWNEITEGTELETVLSKGNRTGGSELICVPLLQNMHSALRIWDQDSMMNGILTVQRSWSSCKGSIEREAICGSDHLAHQRTIQSLKRALQRKYGSTSQHRVWRQRWSQDLLIWHYWISQKPHLFSLYIALQKELKQVTFPTAQMAVTIKVAPNPDVDVHKQRENSIYGWLNLRTSQSCMIPLHWMVGLLEPLDVLLKGFKFIARVSITPSN